MSGVGFLASGASALLFRLSGGREEWCGCLIPRAVPWLLFIAACVCLYEKMSFLRPRRSLRLRLSRRQAAITLNSTRKSRPARALARIQASLGVNPGGDPACATSKASRDEGCSPLLTSDTHTRADADCRSNGVDGREQCRLAAAGEARAVASGDSAGASSLLALIFAVGKSG